MACDQHAEAGIYQKNRYNAYFPSIRIARIKPLLIRTEGFGILGKTVSRKIDEAKRTANPSEIDFDRLPWGATSMSEMTLTEQGIS